jgi:hypothetical protein
MLNKPTRTRSGTRLPRCQSALQKSSPSRYLVVAEQEDGDEDDEDLPPGISIVNMFLPYMEGPIDYYLDGYFLAANLVPDEFLAPNLVPDDDDEDMEWPDDPDEPDAFI